MTAIDRRSFLAAAAAMGATAVLGGEKAAPSRLRWTERRDLFREGVGSGDPDSQSVLLWTRREFPAGAPARLTVEVAEDREFQRVVASAQASLSPASDWTCRVLVGGLRPAREYWYRFVDEQGLGSRIGRTLTAPADDDPRPVRFSFVSCQSITEGALNAYRRMIWEDERAPEGERLGFVLHLGDYIYEVVWYPEDLPQGRRYDRRIRGLFRLPHGEKISNFHVPTTVEDYRTLYREWLHDPDLQDARARWPFVCVWDNHEFSWRGFQSIQKFGESVRPAQRTRVAANQAWFEYQPARVRTPSGPSLERFDAPEVKDAPIERFDENGLGQEPNNLKAIGSLTIYRALRWGRNVDLILTDHHSYRADDPSDGPAAAPFESKDFPYLVPQEVIEVFDAGRAHGGNKPPATIRYGSAELPNPRKDAPPLTLLGAEQKAWFKERLRRSTATWKIWGNSSGTLDMRTDPQNLPEGVGARWPGAGYALFGGGGWSGCVTERAEVLDLVREAGITGFAVVAGDRHSFWAGLAAKALPPQPFDPVGVEFITGSLSAPGLVEALEYRLAKDHPLRALYLAQVGADPRPHPTLNMLVRHGVRSCLEYARSGDAAAARRLSNPDLAPHLRFLDMAGHGYGAVRVTSEAIECEFVCIPRPLERSASEDGGPLRYRVVHRASLWRRGERPSLEQRMVSGSADLS